MKNEITRIEGKTDDGYEFVEFKSLAEKIVAQVNRFGAWAVYKVPIGFGFAKIVECSMTKADAIKMAETVSGYKA